MPSRPLALVLTPTRTMATAFTQVVAYQSYRLRNTRRELSRSESIDIYHLKMNVDGIHPKFGTFYGRKKIWLLPFLTNIRDKFNEMGTGEVEAVRVSEYFMGGEAKDVHAEKFAHLEYDFGDYAPRTPDNGTWRHVHMRDTMVPRVTRSVPVRR